jgi:hypothetical protein
LGHVLVEPVTKPKPTLTLSLREATNYNMPIVTNMEVTACAKLDTACATPVAGPQAPNAMGNVAFALDAGFAGFFEIKSLAQPAAYVPFLFFVNPPVNGDRTNVVPLISGPNFAGLVIQASGGGGADPSLGNVVFWAQDCVGGFAEGVTATIDGAVMPVDGGVPTGTRFFLVNSLPSLSETATDVAGAGGFLNVVPGAHVITAVRKATGASIARVSVLVRAGAISFASLPPLP